MIFPLEILILSITIIHSDAIGIIGIFSAPQNCLQRHTIRNTWAKGAKLLNLTYKFVIGNEQCELPVINRTNEFDCRTRNYLPSNYFFSTSDYLHNKRAGQCANGFGFLANNNFYITHIGILRQFIDLYKFPVRVKLRDALTGRQLSSVTFYDKTVNLKAINTVYFPRGSEGILEEQEPSKFCYPFTSEYSEDILSISSIVRNRLAIPEESHLGISIFFHGRLKDGEAASDSNESLNIKQTEENLLREQNIFNDILFVNVTDVYRNLPLKLFKFFETINTYNFSYVIKTDDDSLLDLKRVEFSLRFSSNQNMWWWSVFKEFWALSRFGKWRESVFKSITYPPFPCGGGYVVSKEVVKYITNMKDDLRIFQGEDVSLGIWLSGLNIQNYCPKNELFQAFSVQSVLRNQCEDICSWTCDNAPMHKPRCNLVQLSPVEMFEKWKSYLKRGYLK